jgi:hypothetical protein
MGLYGSFPLFHLSNLMMASLAESRVSEKSDYRVTTFPTAKVSFMILGDDVVFSDELVAEEYKGIMSSLGVEISVQKSFSGQVAEFAGFLTFPTFSKGKVTSFRPYKYPDVGKNSKVTNGLQFLHALGARVKSISPYWEDMFHRYTRTLGQRDITLSPLVSDTEEDSQPSYVSDQYLTALMQSFRILWLERQGSHLGEVNSNPPKRRRVVRTTLVRSSGDHAVSENNTAKVFPMNGSVQNTANTHTSDPRSAIHGGNPSRNMGNDEIRSRFRNPLSTDPLIQKDLRSHPKSAVNLDQSSPPGGRR